MEVEAKWEILEVQTWDVARDPSVARCLLFISLSFRASFVALICYRFCSSFLFFVLVHIYPISLVVYQL